VPFGRVAKWLKLFALLAYAPWFRAVTLIVLVIVLVCNSRAVSDSMESVQRANPVLTDSTSFKRCVCSPRLLFRAVRTAKAPMACALCLGLILTNRWVLGQAGLAFAACSGGLWVG
jgi:hypothetical protein